MSRHPSRRRAAASRLGRDVAYNENVLKRGVVVVERLLFDSTLLGARRDATQRGTGSSGGRRSQTRLWNVTMMHSGENYIIEVSPSGRTGGQTSGRPGGRTGGRTGGLTGGRTGGPADGSTVETVMAGAGMRAYGRGRRTRRLTRPYGWWRCIFSTHPFPTKPLSINARPSRLRRDVGVHPSARRRIAVLFPRTE